MLKSLIENGLKNHGDLTSLIPLIAYVFGKWIIAAPFVFVVGLPVAIRSVKKKHWPWLSRCVISSANLLLGTFITIFLWYERHPPPPSDPGINAMEPFLVAIVTCGPQSFIGSLLLLWLIARVIRDARTRSANKAL